MVSCLIFFFFSMSLNWFFALFVVLGKNPPSPRVELVIRICAWAILGAFALVWLAIYVAAHLADPQYASGQFVFNFFFSS